MLTRPARLSNPSIETVDVGRHVAWVSMGLLKFRGTGGVDDGGEIRRAGWSGRRTRYGRRGAWPLVNELIHEQAGCSEIAGNLEMIHDHDFLKLSLGKNCEDLAQLMLGDTKITVVPESLRV